MPNMQGKRAFLELLRQEGVDKIFGNPGTTELPLMDALAVETGIDYVLGLNESAVMAMADGYAQASGKVAVCNVHVAPGLGNAMGMLYDAKKAGSPVLVTAGQHDQAFTFQEPILWDDLATMARPLVKWSVEVTRLVDLPRAVHRAIKTALAPPMGPVFLSLPVDVLQDTAEIDLGRPTRVARNLRGDPEAVAAAAKLLARAKSPVLIAGDAVAQSDAHAEMVALAELLGAPVYAEGIPSRATFPSTHPLFQSNMQRLSPQIRAALEPHDVLFSVGGDLFTQSLPTKADPVPPTTAIIHLDTDPWELGKNHPEEIAILGDPKSTLPDIIAALKAELGAEGLKRGAVRLDAAKKSAATRLAALHKEADALASATPVKPLALMKAIGDLVPKDAVIVEEALSSADRMRFLIPSLDSKSWYGLRGGGIGWGVPATIGIKLAQPSRPVVGIIGDGSSMYAIQALWSAAHHRIGCAVFVILNNGSYRILKQRMNAMREYAAQADHYPAMDLVDPAIDFVGLAASLGVKGARAGSVAEFRDIFKRAVAGDAPFLIDVAMDRAFKPV
ncbi:MAG TPA: thiamine pyrophosphate-binding protein [Hyphomicrobiaceae bacterium]|nr:thiamine pyrophosphate-binding protein [Hyphomicrobiaceae bacterium]